MKPAPRDISLVERQIVIAKKNNQPRVIAKLEKELEELKAVPFVRFVAEPVRKMNMNTYDNKAAFLFYNS